MLVFLFFFPRPHWTCLFLSLSSSSSTTCVKLKIVTFLPLYKYFFPKPNPLHPLLSPQLLTYKPYPSSTTQHKILIYISFSGSNKVHIFIIWAFFINAKLVPFFLKRRKETKKHGHSLSSFQSCYLWETRHGDAFSISCGFDPRWA